MIRAHMATFPARRAILERAVARIAPQVEKLCVVLNEYDEVPQELAQFDNVEPIIPDEDLKDVGKFLPEVAPNDRVFLVDDDIAYPDNYMRRSLRLARGMGFQRRVFGYHGSRFDSGGVESIRSRRLYGMNKRQDTYIQVDHLGTGSVLTLGRYMPSLDYMMSSQKFVDVRFARYQYEGGIALWSLPRRRRLFPNLLTELDEDAQVTIADTFTANWPQSVIDEVNTYAGAADAAEAQASEGAPT
ncbi:MAG: hypothetical protein HKN63_07125 [Rhodobacteraceae bacterium]|nr:hypothetical protein [Paracoccaceae bacterium]